MKVIIAGSREITDYSTLVWAMESADLIKGIVPTEIVSGRCPRGVDMLGERWALEHGLPVQPFPARWRDSDGVLNRSAGKQRNGVMARYAQALVAVWDGKSPGTADMIKKANARKLLVWVEIVTLPYAGQPRAPR